MSDLFDGVKAPKERAEEPAQAAQAPARNTTTKPAEKTSGVPVARLMGWAVPLLAVALVIVLWSVSMWLAIAAGIAAVVGLVAVGIVRLWQRRSGRSSRTVATRSRTIGPTGRTLKSSRTGGLTGQGSGKGGRTGSRMNPGNWFKGGRSGGQSTSGRSSAGRSAKGSGRTAKRAPSGQAAGTDGHRGGRSWLRPGRRSASSGGHRGGRGFAGLGGRRSGGSGGQAGGGRGSRSGAGQAPKGGAAAGMSGSRWSRSRANPTTWTGPRRAKATAARKAVKRLKQGEKQAEKETDGKPKAEETPGKTARRKRRWWPWRRTKTTGEKPGEDKTAEGDDPKSKNPKKEEKKSDKKKGQKEEPPKDKTEPEVRIGTDADDFPFDDAGFPIAPDPNWKPRPKPAPKPLNVDDGGFISPPVPKQPKIKAPKRTKENRMSDRTENQYVSQIDPSSKESFRASAQEAAKEARRDAATKEDEAGELRRQAAQWREKGVDSAAEPLLREAAALEETAEQRRQAAAAYEKV